MDAAELTAFTKEVSERFDAGEIPGPVHLNSDTQIEPLIRIFRDIKPTDWCLSTWRSTYHALLKGVPKESVMKEILAGRSMQLHFPEYRFMSSSIMGGLLPIACGLAAGGQKVWCFVGDMCASTGGFMDAATYSAGHSLPVNFIIEDNGLSTNTPTKVCWKSTGTFEKNYNRYFYERTTPHYGTKPATGF